jgi:peptidyl-prolyl cis-trans isomerase A (cyclophilin A)
LLRSTASPRRFLVLIAALLALLVVPARALPTNRPTPGYVRVRIETSQGPIVVSLDTKRAPRTSANFLAYVDDGRFDGTTFYRAARRKSAPAFGLIQGGIDMDARRSIPPVAHEPTTKTGISHLDGTLSMARPNRPDSAMGNFFMTIGATPTMDARGDYIGYAAFGHVVGGMDTVKRILALPTGGGTGAMRGQMILKPVRIIRAVRIDGKPQPTGRIKPWLLGLNRKQ